MQEGKGELGSNAPLRENQLETLITLKYPERQAGVSHSYTSEGSELGLGIIKWTHISVQIIHWAYFHLSLSPLPRQVHGNISVACTNLIWLYWARYLKFTFSTFNCFPPNLKSGYIRPRKIANRFYWMISRFALLSIRIFFPKKTAVMVSRISRQYKLCNVAHFY